MLALLLLGLLGGCVNLPTSGPVEKVEGQQPACQSCVNVEVAPPAPDATPREIVDGFLRANANYQPGYAVARQFLTEAAAASWSTDQGVTIYSGFPSEASGSRVRLTGEVVGSLNQQHTFRVLHTPLSRDFTLERENGNWRIANPLPGLLVRDTAFRSLYRSYDLYFVGATGALVPEPIYLPDLRAPGNVASALVSALLSGPSDWLSPAVSTAAPTRTSLSVESVTILNGVAQVPLSDDIAQTTDAQRSLLAAQLVYTLQQVTGVKKVLLQVGNQPFRVPQSETGDLAVPFDAVSSELNPVPYVPTEQLYAVRNDDHAVVEVNGNIDVPTSEPLPGPLGEGRYDISSLSVSVGGTELALVTDAGTVLRRATTSGTAPTTVLEGVSGLLRPQFSRTDELFVVGDRDGEQQMWLDTDGRTSTVSATEVLREGRVLAYRVSPDGARMALIVQSDGRTRLGLARIVRSTQVSVEGWRELQTSTALDEAALGVVRDLAWTSPTELLVLGADTARGPFTPATVSIDGSQVDSEPQTDDWDAVELAVLLRTQTAIPIVRAEDGRAFRDDGTQWQLVLKDVDAVAYPG